ncbi:Rho termination factor N-terminal domain-containing protein [Salinicoccus roseus]|uniref:Rho termination factor N-terminal domain-containing protein n=1 Tax=Salinicoccus roseus TaxID=45670 RepID=UPI0035619F2F
MSELFPVEKGFRDKQDNERLYVKDGWYPRRGLEPSDDRVAELQEKGFIGGEGASDEAPDSQNDQENADYKDMTVSELKDIAEEKNIEGYTDMKKAELIEALQD